MAETNDYELDTAELLRLAQLASEYAYTRSDERDLANYADGINHALLYLAGELPVTSEPTLAAILEVNPAHHPRLIGQKAKAALRQAEEDLAAYVAKNED